MCKIWYAYFATDHYQINVCFLKDVPGISDKLPSRSGPLGLGSQGRKLWLNGGGNGGLMVF